MARNKADLLDECQVHCDTARLIITQAVGRELTQQERQSYEEHMKAAKDLHAEIEKINADKRKVEKEKMPEQEVVKMALDGQGEVSGGDATRAKSADGREYRIFQPGEKITLGDTNPAFHIGEAIRAALTRKFDGLTPENRVASEAILTSGGMLLPENTAAEFIGANRENLAVGKVCTYVTLPNGILNIIGCKSDGTAGWTPEYGEITEVDPQFFKIEMRARKVAGYVKASIELAQHSDFAARVRDSLSFALQKAISQAAFEGLGNTDQPQGLLTNPDITGSATNFTDAASAAITMANYVDNAIWGGCLSNNAQPPLFMVSHGDWHQFLDTLLLAAATPYALSWNGTPASWKNIVPVLANELDNAVSAAHHVNIYTLPRGALYVGFDPQNITIEVFRGGDDMVKKGEVYIRAYAMVDVACPRPGVCHVYHDVDAT